MCTIRLPRGTYSYHRGKAIDIIFIFNTFDDLFYCSPPLPLKSFCYLFIFIIIFLLFTEQPYFICFSSCTFEFFSFVLLFFSIIFSLYLFSLSLLSLFFKTLSLPPPLLFPPFPYLFINQLFILLFLFCQTPLFLDVGCGRNS